MWIERQGQMETVTDTSLSPTDFGMKTGESVVYAGILGNAVKPRCFWALCMRQRPRWQIKHKHGTEVTTKRGWRPLHCGPASTQPSRPPGAAGSSPRGCGTAIRQGMVLRSDDRRGGDRSVGADTVEGIGVIVCGIDVEAGAPGRRRRTRGNGQFGG